MIHLAPYILLAALLLSGCSVTLYSREWDASTGYDPADIRDASGHLPGDDPGECDQAEHNPVGGYIPACGALPGLLGDDC